MDELSCEEQERERGRKYQKDTAEKMPAVATVWTSVNFFSVNTFFIFTEDHKVWGVLRVYVYQGDKLSHFPISV